MNTELVLSFGLAVASIRMMFYLEFHCRKYLRYEYLNIIETLLQYLYKSKVFCPRRNSAGLSELLFSCLDGGFVYDISELFNYSYFRPMQWLVCRIEILGGEDVKKS